jgi:uncharacterized protein YycO
MKNTRKACAFVLGAALFAPVLASAQNNNMNGMNMPAQTGQQAAPAPTAAAVQPGQKQLKKELKSLKHKVNRRANRGHLSGIVKGRIHAKQAKKLKKGVHKISKQMKKDLAKHHGHLTPEEKAKLAKEIKHDQTKTSADTTHNPLP